MQCPRRLDHRGNQINAGHGGAGLSHHRRDMSRTTADLEGPAVARQVRRVEQVAHRVGRQLRGVLRVDWRRPCPCRMLGLDDGIRINVVHVVSFRPSRFLNRSKSLGVRSDGHRSDFGDGDFSPTSDIDLTRDLALSEMEDDMLDEGGVRPAGSPRRRRRFAPRRALRLRSSAPVPYRRHGSFGADRLRADRS